MLYDVIIVGSGPAGLTSALYAERSGLKVLILEKFMVGGQVITTYEIENYPGFLNISGSELINKMEEQVKNLGVSIVSEEVLNIDYTESTKKVITNKNTYCCKSIIFSLGATPKLLGIPGEDEFRAKGVSYCATCDGSFFRKKDVVVVGGGNTAVEDAIFLSRLCNKVYLVHRRDTFRADKKLVDNLIAIDNIEILYDSVVEQLSGENILASASIKNLKTNQIKIIDIKGAFIAVGITPTTKLVENMLNLNPSGFIITNEIMETNIEGIFAAGDCRSTPLKQIITSASDGAIAAYSASGYIAKL